MAGLLGDSWDDPKTQAVMQMAAGLLGGGNFGQALGRGLGGYQETMANAKKAALIDEEMQFKRGERKRAEDQRQRESEVERLIREQFMPVTGPQAIQGDALGPTVAKAQNIGQMPQVNYQQLAAMGVPMERLKALAEAPNLGRAEVARTLETDGPDGSKLIRQLDRWGKDVVPGMPGYVAPVQVNQGDKITFAKPQAGQTFNVGMSPAEQQRVAQGWASQNLARERFNFDQRGGADAVMGGAKLPPGYMWAAPGQAMPIPGTEAAQKAQLASREKQSAIDNAKGALALVDQAIAHPGRTTATGLSSVLDPRNYVPGTQAKDFQAIKDQISGGAFLQAFESLKGGGAITEIEGKKAEMAIARMQTSQSDQAFEQALKDYRSVIETGMRRLGGGQQQTSPSTFDPAKESRYQAWKRAQGMN